MGSRFRPLKPLAMDSNLAGARMTMGARRVGWWLGLCGFLTASTGALWCGWLHNAGGRLFDATWPLLRPLLPF